MRRRPCGYCSAKRAKLASQLAQGDIPAAAKTAAEGVQVMLGLKPKIVIKGTDETPPDSSGVS